MYVHVFVQSNKMLSLDAHRSSPNPTSVKEVEESGPVTVDKVDLSITVEQASDDSSTNDMIKKKQPPNKPSSLVRYYQQNFCFI